MANYTKGPWFYKRNSQTYYVDASIGGGMLQEVAACGPTENWVEQEANARLISKAPETIKALQNALSLLSDLGLENSDEYQEGVDVIWKALGDDA